MPNRVVWNLSYPTYTPDEQARFRHHFEALRNDSHVASIEATERADTPFIMTMRVEFAEGHDRPDSQELRHADSLYPSTANIERHIEIPSQTPEQAQEMIRRLRFEMPHITGLSAADMVDRMRQVVDALRVPDLRTVFEALGTGIEGFREPIKIPEWIVVGRAYRQKAGEKLIVTLQRVRFDPTNIVIIVIGTLADEGTHLEYTLSEFVEVFEPYERPPLPLSAWERVLQDDED